MIAYTEVFRLVEGELKAAHGFRTVGCKLYKSKEDVLHCSCHCRMEYYKLLIAANAHMS